MTLHLMMELCSVMLVILCDDGSLVCGGQVGNGSNSFMWFYSNAYRKHTRIIEEYLHGSV